MKDVKTSGPLTPELEQEWGPLLKQAGLSGQDVLFKFVKKNALVESLRRLRTFDERAHAILVSLQDYFVDRLKNVDAEAVAEMNRRPGRVTGAALGLTLKEQVGLIKMHVAVDDYVGDDARQVHALLDAAQSMRLPIPRMES